jgi:hypothetical protein
MILLEVPNYGPFAPVVGYAAAIMASGGALFVMWGGKMKKWRPPSEDLPGTAQTLVLLLCGVFMVVEFYFAEPANIRWLVGSTALVAVCCVFCFLRYTGLIGRYGYLKPVPSNKGKIEQERILGGRVLRPEAERKRIELGIDEQALLEGAIYKVGALWDKDALQWVKTRVLLFFILTLVLGTSALTIAGFTTQVVLTQKAAARVIDRNDAPGLSKAAGH